MSAPLRILSVFGTRPEAIKMAPVVHALNAEPGIDHSVCITAQHREMLDSVLSVFNIQADIDLNVMAPNQGLNDIVAAVTTGLQPVLQRYQPDRVLVHGDTTTTMATALAAYHARISVGHVEAGLRTGDRYAPFPEEMNRRIADTLSDLHFAPTATSRANLLAEGINDAGIHITGNTVIDALLAASDLAKLDDSVRDLVTAAIGKPAPSQRLVLVTGHRRENFGDGFENICQALLRLATRDDVHVIYPVHLNPNVREPVFRLLGDHPRIRLIEPLSYLPFVALMNRATIIVTDSGGIQEEAPALGKPVLVMRDTSERPEAIDSGTVKLVGTDPDTLVSECATLLDNPDAYATMSRAINPYGDGKAAQRITDILMERPFEPWSPPPQ